MAEIKKIELCLLEVEHVLGKLIFNRATILMDGEDIGVVVRKEAKQEIEFNIFYSYDEVLTRVRGYLSEQGQLDDLASLTEKDQLCNFFDRLVTLALQEYEFLENECDSDNSVLVALGKQSNYQTFVLPMEVSVDVDKLKREFGFVKVFKTLSDFVVL